MKKMGKYIGMIALLFVVCMAKNSQTAKAADTMTMTELYNSKDYEEARANERTITVSSLGEFTMFQKAAAEDAKGLSDLSFVQTQDIVASECTFSYDKDSNMIVIRQDETVLGYIDRKYKVYNQQKEKASWKELGLEDALSYDKSSTPVDIKGNYNGQNHVLKGFIIGNVGMATTTWGALFANMDGDIKDLYVKDCCVLKSYGPIANVSGGKLLNVTTQNCVGLGTDISGMVGWACGNSIDRCTVKDCTLIRANEVDNRTRFGGIASVNSSSTIQNSSVKNIHIYSPEDTDFAAGGIVGYIDEKSQAVISGCVVDCDIEHFSKAGGIVGEVEDSFSTKIVNCISRGKINYTANGGMNGGIVGKITGSSIVAILNSVSTVQLDTTAYSGGLVVNASEDATIVSIKNCLFSGKVSADETGALVAGTAAVNIQQSYAIQSAGALFCSDILDVIVSKNCYSVSQKQIRGTEESQVITDTGIYKGFCHVLDMLNRFVRRSTDQNLVEWTALDDGLPVPALDQDILNTILNTENEDPISDDTPVISPTTVPSATPVISPTTVPSATPVTSPTAAPSVTPVTSPTAAPSATPVVSPTTDDAAKDDHSGNGTNDKKNDTSSDQSGTGSNHSNSNAALTTNVSSDTAQRKTVSVNRLKAEALSNKSVKFTWDKKSNFSKMILYYSTDGRKYKKITTCNSKKHAYTWKAGKPGKKYYFRFVTYQLQDGRQVKGRTVTKKLLLPTLKTPTYQLSIGKSGKQKYMQIKLKRYQGRYVEISLKKGNATFKKAPMVSDKIAYYHGKILFTYKKGGVTYSCKLRTYLIKNGRKKYSAYSKVKKIRI
ncbi:MAG: hypothetical protein U0J62_07740 [Lachnospiraceae bacterium]|nr:hypothetical protein [Lachnospiraceae bacterium]